VSGQTQLYSPYAEITQTTIKFHSDHPPDVTLKHSVDQRNLVTLGNRTAVVMRIIPNDTIPYTEAEIFDRVFNTSTYSLRTGYDACSYGQLDIRPSTHALAVNGVVNVTVPMNAIGTNMDVVKDAALTKATALLGDLPSQFDLVLLAMPPGVVNGDGGLFTNAFAYSYLSVYSMSFFTISALMHEIGHNLNYGHSGEGSDEYGDQTCVMGYGYGETYSPKMCFNGAKSFILGWYSSRTKTWNVLSSDTSTVEEKFTLIGVADYQNPNNDANSLVVFKLETGSTDYYISFNRRIGINSEVQEYGDHVMVVSQGDNPGSQSWIVTKFNTVGDYTISNIGESTFDMIISVSSMNLWTNPATATVSIKRIVSRGFGSIRSYVGLCIDVWGSNGITIGNYAYAVKCNTMSNQLWFRQGSSDNRLQVYKTDLCMDLERGNTTTDWDYVILQTCDETKSSQQWVYDGPTILLKDNNGLCLKIQGTIPKVGSRLIVGPCDHEFSSKWVEYSKSTMVGYPTYQHNHLLCPVGSSVINISGRAGSWMDQLVMTCSDGTVLGPVGGNGGSVFTSAKCVSGYSNVTMKPMYTVVGMLEAYCRGSSYSKVGTNGDLPVSLTLNVDEEIIGMDVYSGMYVNALAFLYWSRPEYMITPTSRPSANPTRKPSTSLTKKATRPPSSRPSVNPTKNPSRQPSRRFSSANLPQFNHLWLSIILYLFIIP
jgi:hypothetical protein